MLATAPHPFHELSHALVGSGVLAIGPAAEVAPRGRLSDSAEERPVEEKFNLPTIREVAVRLADAISEARHDGLAPLVYGKDSSVLLGCGLALARRGRHALVFLDADPNYDHPDNEEAFEMPDAELAIITGSGLDLLANIENRRPYLQRHDVLTFGIRSGDRGERRKLDELQSAGIGFVTLTDGRALGMEWVGRALADSYEKQPELDGFWIHLDSGVLESSIITSEVYPELGRLTPDELTTLLARLVRSPRFAGMDVVIRESNFGSDGSSQRRLNNILAKVFTPHGQSPFA